VKKLVALAAAVGALGALAKSMSPEVRRYIKIERM